MCKALLFLCLILAPLNAQTKGTVDYKSQVNTILEAKCTTCHNTTKRSGGLSLFTYDDVLNGGRNGAIVRPGKGADSLMIMRLNGSIEPRMPQDDAPLTDEQIATIKKWIDEGARPTPKAPQAKPKWEPRLSLTAPPIPASPWKSWTSPIDSFTAAYLAKHKIKEIQPVSDAVFARRAYLDIWGLLPDPGELRAFLADNAPGKRAKLVATLLADNKKYTEHWISYWNDLLRNDEGVVYYSETAQRKSISRWLYSAIESNQPFDKWIHQLLSPTEITDPDGFLIGVNWRGTVSASQTAALQAAQNTAQIFLGINLKCNSCHDSFISKWKLKDAYSLAAYFSNEDELQLYRCDTVTEQFAKASFLYPDLNRPLPSSFAVDRRAAAAALFTDPGNGRMPRTLVNRIWHRLMGRGIVENVDEMDGEPFNAQLFDWLAADFASNGYDLKRLIAQIVESRTYQLPTVSQRGDSPTQYVFKGPELRRISAEQFADAVASITGDWRVGPAVLEFTAARGNVAPLLVSGRPFDGSINAASGGQAVAPRGGAAAATALAAAPLPIPPGSYTREWRLAATNLTRALGRPIRDQVYSTRDTQATMLQALELVNGELLNRWLWRGSRKLLGELPSEPKSLFSGQTTPARASSIALSAFDLDVSKSQKLYLIVQDALSTAPDRATPLWIQAELTSPDGTITQLSSLRPQDNSGIRDASGPITVVGGELAKDSLRVKFPSVLIYDIAGKGFTRFRGSLGFENTVLNQGETVTSRFYVFDQNPTMDRLVPPNPETPRPIVPLLQTVPETVEYAYQFALGRAPSKGERAAAEKALLDASRPGKPSPDGLADLLWSIMMTPEFQYVR